MASTAGVKRTAATQAGGEVKKVKTVTTTASKKSDMSESGDASSSQSMVPAAAMQPGSVVQIVLNDQSEMSEQQSQQEQGSPVASAVVAATATPGAPILVMTQQLSSIKQVQKINWRWLAQKDNFARMVTLSPLNPKSEGCFVKFNNVAYEKETGERFSNPITRNSLTFEGPWMKCITGLHDTKEYPGSFSMMLAIDDYQADPEVPDFVEFMDRIFDGFFKQQIFTHGYDWMKKEKKYERNLIVEKNKNTSDATYKRSWIDGTYTPEMYESDVMAKCINPSLRTMGQGGTPSLYVKVYPVKDETGKINLTDAKGNCVPDVMIFNSADPPRVLPYVGCKISEPNKTWVKPLISISRVSYAKEKFHITPVTRVVQVMTQDDLNAMSSTTGGSREMSFKFDGQKGEAVKIKISGRNNEAGDAAGEP